MGCVGDVVGKRRGRKGKRREGRIKNDWWGRGGGEGGGGRVGRSGGIERVVGENGKKLFLVLLLL